MMELSPLSVHEPAGTCVTFKCSYKSNERLHIEFEALSMVRMNEKRRMMSRREVLEDIMHRYVWGDTRHLTLVIQPEHGLVNCNLRNSQGFIVGQLTAVIHAGQLLYVNIVMKYLLIVQNL